MLSENEDDIPLQKIKTKLLQLPKAVVQKSPQNKLSGKPFCCVCLKNLFQLYELNAQSCKHGIKFLVMLRSSIPDIEWSSSYNICESCCSSLDDAYTFWKSCMNNEYLMKKATKMKYKKECNSELIDDILLDKIHNNEKLEIKEESRDTVSDIEENDNPTDEGVDDFNEDAASDSGFTNNENLYEDSEEETQKKKIRRKAHSRSVHIKPIKKVRKRPKREFTCENCDFSTTISTKLVDHYLEQHKMNPQDVKPFKCDTCSKRFEKFWFMVAHSKSHVEDRPSVCTYCGKGFKREFDLQIHEKRHLNMRECKCELCGKGYNTYKDLASHKLAVHTDSSKWKWTCELCHKPFPIKSNYDSHMRRHTGDKKFACHLCPKRFTDKIVLQNHLKVHSNVKNYKCQECNKEYKAKHILMIHLARIHSIGLGQVKIPQKTRKYICHICPKAYFAKDHLTRHLYSHSGERPFGCSICNKKFICKSYASTHEKKCHGGVKSMVDAIE